MDLAFLSDLNVEIETNAELSHYTTFQLGGHCPALIHCKAPAQLETIITRLVENKVKFLLIGGGSNIVVSDQGIDCVVIRFRSQEPLIQQQETELIVSGSTILDDLALFAAENGLAGLNCCTGIPGTVGGAVVGNAGAFGKQIGDVTTSVSLISLDGKVKEVEQNDLKFSYRNSNLKKTGDIVLSVKIQLTQGDRDELVDERHEILNTRWEKHPDLSNEPCAGSVFRNLEPTSSADKRQAAGYFLEEAGVKELTHGGAYIYPKHANIIVKVDDCTAQDVYELSKMMFEAAKKKHRLKLVREIHFVGPFEGGEKKKLIW